MNWAALHALLVNFTAGLLPTAFLADILGRALARSSLANAGRWMITAAAIATPFTAVAGWMWWHTEHIRHWPMPWHRWIGTVLAVLVVAIAVWRWRFRAEAGPRAMASWPYIVVLATVLGGLIIQADLGGTMVFDQGLIFKIGARHGHDADEQDEASDHTHPADSDREEAR